MIASDAAPSADSADQVAVLVRGLRVVLGDRTALRGVDLSVRTGTRLALVGPNGAGKSTLLRVLAGLLRPASGDVQIGGRSLQADPWSARRAVGMVGHRSMLHPDLTARENLTVYARLYGLDHVSERVEAGLRSVGLSDRAGSRLATLSRGMVQRLALARALIHEPSILLLDEAETGLDLRANDLLVAALTDRRRTCIFASHDLAYVRQVADEVIFLNRGSVVGRALTAGSSSGALQERYAEALAHRSATLPRPLRTVRG